MVQGKNSVIFPTQTLWRKKATDFGASVVTWVHINFIFIFNFRSSKVSVSERTSIIGLKCYIWSFYSVSSFISLKKLKVRVEGAGRERGTETSTWSMQEGNCKASVVSRSLLN